MRKRTASIVGLCLVSAVCGGLIGFGIARRAPPSREQVVSYLSGLGVSDLADLLKRLQTQWGIEPTQFKR
jgi:hypothetical protein